LSILATTPGETILHVTRLNTGFRVQNPQDWVDAYGDQVIEEFQVTAAVEQSKADTSM